MFKWSFRLGFAIVLLCVIVSYGAMMLGYQEVYNVSSRTLPLLLVGWVAYMVMGLIQDGKEGV